MATALTAHPQRADFLSHLGALSGEEANLCFQCLKCSTGCPLLSEMDEHPAQIVHAVRLGQDELALSSTTPWLCASCQTCTTRCPQGVDIAGLMDALRIEAQRRGITPVPEVKRFFDAALSSIRRNGRMHELGVVMALRLRSGRLFDDLGLGLAMLRRGKLKLLPHRAAARRSRRLFRRVREVESRELNAKEVPDA